MNRSLGCNRCSYIIIYVHIYNVYNLVNTLLLDPNIFFCIRSACKTVQNQKRKIFLNSPNIGLDNFDILIS